MSWATLNAAANRVAFSHLGSVSVTAGAVSGRGFLVMPGQILADGMSISTDYTLTALAGDFGNLIYGASITVNGVLYTVRDNRLLDDGGFCEVSLQKVLNDSGLVTDPTIDGGGPGTVFPDGNTYDGGAP
jgi:hypothetical protein